MILRIGTRQSPLARWQANHIASLLAAQGVEVEMVPIVTSGDVSTGPLGASGGVGLFTKEIQRALIDKRCDLAVHSLKDLPTEYIDGLWLAAVPEREDPRDCFIGRISRTLQDLPQEATVGTGSLRRAAQVRQKRPDLKVIDIRGNVDSRIKKLDDQLYDGILLASAGLRRLELIHRVTHTFSLDEMLPAVGQAALGLETRADDKSTRAIVETLIHYETHQAVLAERALLRRLRGGCLAPVAAHAVIHNKTLHLKAKVFSLDGSQVLEQDQSGLVDTAESIGEACALQLISAGASELIAQARQAPAR